MKRKRNGGKDRGRRQEAHTWDRTRVSSRVLLLRIVYTKRVLERGDRFVA